MVLILRLVIRVGIWHFVISGFAFWGLVLWIGFGLCWGAPGFLGIWCFLRVYLLGLPFWNCQLLLDFLFGYALDLCFVCFTCWFGVVYVGLVVWGLGFNFDSSFLKLSFRCFGLIA